MTMKKPSSKKPSSKNTMKKTEEKKQTTVLEKETPKTEETTPKTEETTQTTTTQVKEDVPKRYYAQFWKKLQPADSKFDEVVGTIYWSDIKEDIIIEGLHPKYSSDIEGFLEGDLALPNGVFISRYETPKEWVRNLHKANFIDGFYGKEFMEVIDEAE